MIPVAIVVAWTVSKIEIAVSQARTAGLPSNAGRERWAFGVVTGPETFGVVRIDQAVVITVLAISAFEKMVRTGDLITGEGPCAVGDTHASGSDLNGP
jgi:hypothetical protein